MNTYRPLNEKFQNGPILTKTPYYRPWFFGVLGELLKELNFDKKPLQNVQEDPMNTCYRPLNEKFQILTKTPYYIDHGFLGF